MEQVCATCRPPTTAFETGTFVLGFSEKAVCVLDSHPVRYKDYQWIVADPQLLGGKLAVRGTRLSVALILECLANGMSLQDIDEAFDRAFPHEALPEVLKVVSELTDSFHVAA
jgi:uncharacterized protein (DUF433 family)